MSRYLLFINGAVLLGCAVFDFSALDIEVLSRFDIRTSLIMVLLLLLPFADRYWSWSGYRSYRYQIQLWLGISAAIVLIVMMDAASVSLVLSTVFLIALPEEWFFRAYFMQRLESILAGRWRANVLTSVLFAALHVPTQGLFGLTVFVPSLFFGWCYQRQKDLILVVLLHALFNIVYLYYLSNF